MEVTSSSIDRQAIRSSGRCCAFDSRESRSAIGRNDAHLEARQLITCAFYLQNNFVHPLDSGCEVCMIRNEKSQLNPPFTQNDLFHFGNERRFIRMAAASYGTAAFPLFAPVPAFSGSGQSLRLPSIS
jgi:hypothetical protein